ncbi:hypothetical protein KL86DPRO_30069 [uncultured delta proteobacterium]|uniref:Uncharacterized protein n=1 Tax=uncultured delta proteobacterium TaxID=34034 RepID=A0A212K724_9DELT|nr:hypothetical protein KL86DPRO_30069 [uncultured delta proteobacterium]
MNMVLVMCEDRVFEFRPQDAPNGMQ